MDLTKHPYKPDLSRVSICAGYRAVYCPNHPKAWSTGYIHEHKLIAEVKIGRLLEDDEIVHHEDEDKGNNEPENLIVKTRSEHAREHQIERGRSSLELTCEHCGFTFKRKWNQRKENKGNKRNFCSRSCSGKFYGALRANKMAS